MKIELVIAAIVLIAGVVFYRLTSRKRVSNEWPRVKGRVRLAKVVPVTAKSGQPAFELRADIFYSIGGAQHTAVYDETFTDEEQANKVMTSLKTGPLWVRYNPANHEEYSINPYEDAAKR